MEQQNNNKKLTDKAFSRFVITSVIGILVCIACLCSTTFAWFTGATESPQNMISSGKFELSEPEIVFVGDPDAAIEITLVQTDGVWSCELPAGTYRVTLKTTDESNVKGHCVVTLGNNEPQHTDAIVSAKIAEREGFAVSDPFTFSITLNEPTTLTVESRWGLAADAHIHCD